MGHSEGLRRLAETLKRARWWSGIGDAVNLLADAACELDRIPELERECERLSGALEGLDAAVDAYVWSGAQGSRQDRVGSSDSLKAARAVARSALSPTSPPLGSAKPNTARRS